MYPKGGEMLHTIRQIVGDDAKWRGILLGLNKTFWHQTVMGKQIEDYISAQAGVNLTKVFDQYLRTTMVPTFEYRIVGDTLVVPMDRRRSRLRHAAEGRAERSRLHAHSSDGGVEDGEASTTPADFKVDVNFYVNPKRVE